MGTAIPKYYCISSSLWALYSFMLLCKQQQRTNVNSRYLSDSYTTVPPPWSVLRLLCLVPGNAKGPEKLWESSRYFQKRLSFTVTPRQRKPGHAAGQAKNIWKNDQVFHVKSAYNTGLRPFLSLLRPRDRKGPWALQAIVSPQRCWAHVGKHPSGHSALSGTAQQQEGPLQERRCVSEMGGDFQRCW